MLRRTKIVATLGPATDSADALTRIINAGVDVTRLNFSHGSAAEHQERARQVRETAARAGRFVAILADLQGPKLRIARFRDNKVTLKAGQTFVLDAAMDKEAGDEHQVGIDYEQLIQDVSVGDILVLDDGRIEMEVTAVNDHSITSQVLIGGPLSNNKGLNKRGGGLSADALTDKDREDIKTAATLGAVVLASDAVMVARGDLAVEIGDAELVGVQKHIIARARTLNRVVITATQMMESMIDNPMPTRAEVSDVANAVMDYTDAVMLSAETAVGDYPVQAVEAMVRICLGAERHPSMHQSRHRMHEDMVRVDEAIALSAMYAANHLDDVKAIICLTETGATPLMMSRIKSGLPIFAFSRHFTTQHRVALFRGVQTVPFDSALIAPEATNSQAITELVSRGIVSDGDLVVMTKGDYVNAQGGTNTMKIIRVGADIL